MRLFLCEDMRICESTDVYVCRYSDSSNYDTIVHVAEFVNVIGRAAQVPPAHTHTHTHTHVTPKILLLPTPDTTNTKRHVQVISKILFKKIDFNHFHAIDWLIDWLMNWLIDFPQRKSVSITRVMSCLHIMSPLVQSVWDTVKSHNDRLQKELWSIAGNDFREITSAT